jgi:DNA-binding NarL/FixJ family response regulator
MAGNKPILLIDMCPGDMPDAWTILSELGEAERVVRRSSVEEALTFLRGNHVEKPAVIFIDGFEPDAKGFEHLKMFKGNEKFKSIPVIVLAMKADDPAAIDECYRIGVAGYIARSKDLNELISEVRTIREYWTLSELPVCT